MEEGSYLGCRLVKGLDYENARERKITWRAGD